MTFSVLQHLSFTFARSERKTTSQIQYLGYNFCYMPEAFAKFRDSNKCSLSDWPSLFSFERRIPRYLVPKRVGMDMNGKYMTRENVAKFFEPLRRTA